MKHDFVNNQEWSGLPKVFKQYTSIIFNLQFKEVPNPVQLISILLQMNSSYYDFKWNEFITDMEAHEMAYRMKQLEKYNQPLCDHCDHVNCEHLEARLITRPFQRIEIEHVPALYRGQWHPDTNQIQGHGTLLFPCGNILDCHFEHGKPKGKARYFFGPEQAVVFSEYEGTLEIKQGMKVSIDFLNKGKFEG